jgi:hypothetical protein
MEYSHGTPGQSWVGAVALYSKGGWASFNHPAPFANQGACIAYVNNRKRITLLVTEDPIQ